MSETDGFRHGNQKYVILFDGAVEVAAEEKGLGGKEEGGNTDGIDGGYCPKGAGIAQIFSNDTTEEDAKSHADVPRDEDGGVGRATLIVAGYIDGHILEGGPHVTVA